MCDVAAKRRATTKRIGDAAIDAGAIQGMSASATSQPSATAAAATPQRETRAHALGRARAVDDARACRRKWLASIESPRAHDRDYGLERGQQMEARRDANADAGAMPCADTDGVRSLAPPNRAPLPAASRMPVRRMGR